MNDIPNSYVHFENRKFRAVYKIVGKHGEGAYGEVFKVVKKSTLEIFIAKRILKASFQKEGKEKPYLLQELFFISQTRHANIVHGFEAYQNTKAVFIVMEFLSGPTLTPLLPKFPTKTSANHTEEKIGDLLKQMMSAVQYLHANDICHADIKPENFMFATADTDAKLKLLDFGLARFSPSTYCEEFGFSDFRGTAPYVAPEVWKSHYNTDCDIWSIGVIGFNLLFGYNPFDPFGEHDIRSMAERLEQINKLTQARHFDVGKIDDGMGPWFPADRCSGAQSVSLDALSFFQGILQSDPVARLSASEALEHRWLHNNQGLPITSVVIDALTQIGKSISAGSLHEWILTLLCKMFLNVFQSPHLKGAYRCAQVVGWRLQIGEEKSRFLSSFIQRTIEVTTAFNAIKEGKAGGLTEVEILGVLEDCKVPQSETTARARGLFRWGTASEGSEISLSRLQLAGLQKWLLAKPARLSKTIDLFELFAPEKDDVIGEDIPVLPGVRAISAIQLQSASFALMAPGLSLNEVEAKLASVGLVHGRLTSEDLLSILMHHNKAITLTTKIIRGRREEDE
jgi:serine/threonine protein kinase